MAEFDVEAFLEGLENDRATTKGPSERIVKILMNVRDNQGTIVFVPFMSKKFKNFYAKVSGVMEWNGNTTKLDSGKAWYKVLPDEFYEGLTKEQEDLLAEIRGLLNSIEEYDVHDFNTFRYRSYSLFYGVLISHEDSKGKSLTDNVDQPCLFIFPSIQPINALATAISAKCQALKGNKSWITGVLSPSNTGREGVVSMSFRKSSGPGYEATVGFEFNTQYSILVDPKHVFEEDAIQFFNDPVRDLLGWQGDGEDGYFNEEIMKELRDDLKLELKNLKSGNTLVGEEETYENRNGQQDPMKSESNILNKPSKDGYVDDLPF